MRVAYIDAPFKIRVCNYPEPCCGENEIKVKVLYGAICNATDYYIWKGQTQWEKQKIPCILGHEWVGRIVELGPAAKARVPGGFPCKVGDRIVAPGITGGFAEFLSFDPAQSAAIIQVPDEVPDEVAPLAEMLHGGYITGLLPLDVKPGKKVLIQGQGPLGITAAQVARALGASAVVVTDLYSFRLKMSKKLGASATVNVKDKKMEDVVSEIKDNFGEMDAVLFAMDIDLLGGDSPSLNLALRILRDGGCMNTLKSEGINRRAILAEHSFPRGIKYVNKAEAYDRPDIDPPSFNARLLKQGMEWVRRGVIRFAPMITHRLLLEEVGTGLKLCREKPQEVMKVVLKIVQ